MRKSRFFVSFLGLLAIATPFSAGLAPFAIAQTDPDMTLVAPNQVSPPQQTWEERFQDVLRRLRGRMGDTEVIEPTTIKSSANVLRLRYALFGLPSDLSAADLQEMEIDAAALRDCAVTDPKPPEGTEFGLVVLMHDLGNDLLKAIDQY